MKTTVPIGNHEFGVEFTNYGIEKYYLDGQLIEKKWNFQFSGTREFKVGGDFVKIEVSVKPSIYFCRLYLNNQLHVEELFPEFKERIEKAKNRQTPAWLKKTVISLVVVAVALTIYNDLNAI